MMNEPEQPNGGTPQALRYATAVVVWVALLVLTAVTVAVARMHVGNWSILSALGIATLKASLVLSFFMGLRDESRIFWWMLLGTIVTLGTVVGLTFLDILFR